MQAWVLDDYRKDFADGSSATRVDEFIRYGDEVHDQNTI